MIIKLPWVTPIDTNNISENFDDLVRESFAKFTEGTREEYTFVDKLLYIDNLRKVYLREDDVSKQIKLMIGEHITYNLEEYGEKIDIDELLTVEFMQDCYNKGFRPLYEQWDENSSSKNYEILKVILRIVQIVVNYEHDEE